MPVESATYATQFDTAAPSSTDPRSEGDDHLRLIKTVLNTDLGPRFKDWAYTALTATWRAATRVSFDTDETTTFEVGRRVRAAGTSTGTIYGEVSSATYSASTSVNFRWDSSSLSNEAIQFWTSAPLKAVRNTLAVDVRHFDPAADDSTDDATALTNALAAAAGRALVLETGKTYRCTSGLALAANTRLDLNGATLHFVVTGDVLCLQMADDSAVRNGTVKVTGTTTPSNYEYQANIVIGRYQASDAGKTNVLIENVRLEKAGTVAAHGIAILNSTQNVTIRNVHIASSALFYIGVMMHWGADNVTTPTTSYHPENIKIENLYIAAQTFNAADSAGVTISACHNVTVENVICERMTENGVIVFAGDHGYTAASTALQNAALRGIVFRNFRILQLDSNDGSGFEVNGLSTVTVATYRPNVLFENCYVRGTGTGNDATGYEIADSDGVTLLNCVAEQLAIGAQTGRGVFRLQIRGGEYHTNNQAGISISNGTADAYDCLIDGAYIHSNGVDGGNDGGAADEIGIYIANAYRCRVRNCVIGDRDGTDAYQYWAIRVDTADRDHTIENTHFYDTSGGEYIRTPTSNSTYVALNNLTFGNTTTDWISGQDFIPILSGILPDGKALCQLFTGKATPNGTLTAPKGSLCTDATNGVFYINTDGSTTWVVVGTQT